MAVLHAYVPLMPRAEGVGKVSCVLVILALICMACVTAEQHDGVLQKKSTTVSSLHAERGQT